MRVPVSISVALLGLLTVQPSLAQTFAKTFRESPIQTNAFWQVVPTVDGGYAALVSNGVVKLAPSGEPVWATRLFISASKDNGGVATAPDGDILVVARAGGGVCGGALVKLSLQSGMVRWQRTFEDLGCGGYPRVTSIAVSPTGQIVVGGSYSRSEFPTDPALIVMFDADGALRWAKSPFSDTTVSAIVFTASGAIAAIGGFHMGGLVPGTHVVLLDPQGALLWHNGYSTFPAPKLKRIAATADGGLVLAGVQDDNPQVPEREDFMALRLAADGNVVWGRVIRTPTPYQSSDDRVEGVAVTGDGGIVITGTLYDRFPPPDRSAAEARVVKLSSEGAFVWQRMLGGFGFDEMYAIAATSDGGVVTSGATRSWLGPGVDPDDGWLVRMDGNGIVTFGCKGGRPSTSSIESVESAPNPILPQIDDYPLHVTSSDAQWSLVTFTAASQCTGRPSEVSPPHSIAPLRLSSANQLNWESAQMSNSNKFEVYRGTIQNSAVSSFAGNCFASNLTTSSLIDTSLPLLGEAYSYLVAGRNSEGRGTLGYGTNGTERTAASYCP